MRDPSREREHLGSGFLKVGDEVIPVLVLLQASEGHFCTRDVLFGVLKVFEESLLLPNDTLVDVGSGVAEAISLTGLASKDTMEVGSYFVGLTGIEGVALSAAGLEEGSTLSSITRSEGHFC